MKTFVHLSLAVLLLAPGVCRANDDDTEAIKLYQDGKAAFEQGDYQRAHQLFREAYFRSQRPALLFDMASALQKLDRAHEAAEALRAYLRVQPDDPDAPIVEERIRGLEEKQRLLDESRVLVARINAPPPRTPIYKRWWLWTTVGVVAAAGLAVGLGVGLTAGQVNYPSASTPAGRVHF